MLRQSGRTGLLTAKGRSRRDQTDITCVIIPDESLPPFQIQQGGLIMSEVHWRDNWTAALEEAKKLNRPLALEFHMEG